MARPRSIAGLLLYLGWLHARRHPLLVIGALALGATLVAAFVHDGRTTTVRTGDLQVAVLRDGFAVLEASADRHVLELDREGRRRRSVPLPVHADVRVAGSKAGTAVGWLDGSKLKLAQLGRDGRLTPAQTWGKSVTRLCDGVASNELRFGFGWLEADGRVWVVHGPTASEAVALVAAAPPVAHAQQAKPTWCGITSAHDYIALLWRDGDKTFFNMCSKKECSGMVSRIPVKRGHELLAYGCVRDGCLIAVRDEHAKTHVAMTKLSGKLAWTKPLPGAAPSTEVEISGAGGRAFAIGYVSTEGATAARVTREGSIMRVWADPSSTATPSLAWARDGLLVVHREGARVESELVPMPR